MPLADPGDCTGREREIAGLDRLAARARLITLTGPGGVGKTRLLAAAAAALAGRYPDGACLARLADLREPDLVPAMVAMSAGICEEPGVPIADTLAEAMRDRAMLLALDGCDAVPAACAALCERLLGAAPGLLILAACRAPLGAPGETPWPVPPLALPGAPLPGDGAAASAAPAAPCGAARLFAMRAGVAAGDCADARAICRRLAGVPLAIELAAARARQVGAAQVRAGLQEALGPPAAGPGGTAETTRAAIAWACGLLAPAGQVLLRRLSVFASWSTEMAERVCSDGQLSAAQVNGLLASLVAAGLVETMPGERGGARQEPARYRLPGAVRDYAAECLAAAGEAAALGRRFRDYALRRLAYLLSIGPRVPASWPVILEVLRSYEADIANMRAALAAWRDHGEAATGLRVCADLVNYWIAVGTLGEGAWWLDAFLDPRRPPVPDDVRGPALVGRSLLAYDSGERQRAELWAAAGLELCQSAGDERRTGAALDLLSRTAMGEGRAEEALRYATAAVDQCRRAGDSWNHGFSLGSKAYALAALGRITEAMEATAEGLQLMQDIQNQWGAALFQVGIGDIARALGDHAGAREYYLAALPFMRDVMPAPHAADCLARIGSIDIRLGDPAAAREHLAEGLRRGLAAGHRPVIARCLLTLATLEVREGRPGRALTLAAAATAHCEAAGLPPPAPERIARYRAEAAALGDAGLDGRWAAGLSMTSRAAAAYALSPPP